MVKVEHCKQASSENKFVAIYTNFIPEDMRNEVTFEKSSCIFWNNKSDESMLLISTKI